MKKLLGSLNWLETSSADRYLHISRSMSQHSTPHKLITDVLSGIEPLMIIDLQWRYCIADQCSFIENNMESDFWFTFCPWWWYHDVVINPPSNCVVIMCKMWWQHNAILNTQSIYASNGIKTALPHFLIQLETTHSDLEVKTLGLLKSQRSSW